MNTCATRIFDTIDTPVAPRRRAVKMIAHANTVNAGTKAALRHFTSMTPSAAPSCTADFAKKMISREFQPMIDTACNAAGTTHPRDPNCGLVAAMESIPNRTQVGPAASSTNIMPSMHPAPSASPPLTKPR